MPTWFILPQVVTHLSTNPAVHGRESNLRPVDHESDALTTIVLSLHIMSVDHRVCACMPTSENHLEGPNAKHGWVECRIFPLWHTIAISILSSTYFHIFALQHKLTCVTVLREDDEVTSIKLAIVLMLIENLWKRKTLYIVNFACRWSFFCALFTDFFWYLYLFCIIYCLPISLANKDYH